MAVSDPNRWRQLNQRCLASPLIPAFVKDEIRRNEIKGIQAQDADRVGRQFDERQRQQAPSNDHIKPGTARPRPPQGGGSSGGVPVDQNGRECIQVRATGRKDSRIGQRPYSRYDFDVSNNCSARIWVVLITNAGRDHVLGGVQPGATRHTFCTDNFHGNQDCGGGFRAYRANVE